MSQCCTNVVKAGLTLSHQWVSDSTLLSYLTGWPSLRTPTCGLCELGIAANTRHWSNVKLIRGHRLRLWPSVRPMRLNVSCLLLRDWSNVTLYWPILYWPTIKHYWYYVHIVHIIYLDGVSRSDLIQLHLHRFCPFIKPLKIYEWLCWTF